MPLPIVILERMGVDGERTFLRINQRLARIVIWTLRAVADGDAELVILVIMAHGIVQIKFPAGLGDFRRPKMRAERRVGPDERIAAEFPLDEIRGLDDGENLPERLSL